MKVAVIGTGIAGNVAAWKLAREHDITVFEANGWIGGHTHTVDVDIDGRTWPVDTGFIVYNERTYPEFCAILDELGVATQVSDMSFSVQVEDSGLEYCGSSLNALFSQRRNLFRPRHYRMLRDILRFNREAPMLLEPGAPELTLGEFFELRRYSNDFVDHYALPMGAAIWSAVPETMRAMPARFFVLFFANHGLLTIDDRPTWRVIEGGSRNYVDRLTAGWRDRVRLNTPVESVRRTDSHVEVTPRGGSPERFDHVFIATHSDQALALLADPSPEEREVLGAIDYQRNEAVLHTDRALLPRHRRAWASWNYHARSGRDARPAAVTYHMNTLQSLAAPVEFCVTLNHTEAVDSDRVIATIPWEHPVFSAEAIAAQQRHGEINGSDRTHGRTYYCGAYWRYGFHEDGVVSALAALDHFASRTGAGKVVDMPLSATATTGRRLSA